ncbi:MAG TPA: hypothetical protein VD846_06660 [Allosphingosinicella sp.]|nr:hypothetical protein [Allosphingosinicella sp.]
MHGFVGRVYGLSIVVYHFDSYDDLAKHPDCKYAYHVNEVLHRIARRVESLNLVGSMLWPEPVPADFRNFAISRYEWLTISADGFLIRYISVVDCALLLVNEVLELGLKPHQCTLHRLKKRGIPATIAAILEAMLADQGALRGERNARVHHGEERAFTQDDLTFKTAAIFENRTPQGMAGTDCFGRPINLERMFREGLVGLQREFNRSTRILVRQLDRLYDALWDEFEDRFSPRIRAATHGFNVGRRIP